MFVADVTLAEITYSIEQGQKRGHPFGQPDLFIAAIAALQDLVVVSRDLAEFIEAGVPVFDPWASVLHINRDKTALKAPATMEALAKISSKN